MQKVRVGSKYIFQPNPMDTLHPPAAHDVPRGAEVKVVNLQGCPPANTMGMCYIEYNGKFAGMVCTGSLVKA